MARALHVFAGLPSAGRVRLSVVWSRLELDGGGARFFSRVEMLVFVYLGTASAVGRGTVVLGIAMALASTRASFPGLENFFHSKLFRIHMLVRNHSAVI